VPARDRRQRGIARAQWWLGLLFAGSAAVLGFWARLPLPYRDDWDWCRWLLGAKSFSSYLVPHNEHVIPLARLLLQLQYAIEGSNGYTMLVAALASLGLVAALTLIEIRRRWADDPAMARWASGVALVVLCFAWQLQSVVFPAAVLFPLVQMFTAAAIVSLLNADTLIGRARVTWLGLAAAATLAAMLTTTNGLTVPIVLAMIAAGRRMGGRVVGGFALLAVIAAALYGWFVLLPRLSAGPPAEPLASLPVVAAFFLAFYSSLVAQASSVAAVAVGAVLFAAGLYFVVTTLRRGDRPRLEYFATGLLLFTMASAALTAPARASFGIVQVAQSRYASFAQPYWAALFLLAISRLAPHQARALAGPALVASVAALAAQAVIGAIWIAKAENVATAGLALRSGAGDEEWLLTLYPSADTPRAVAAALIADGDRSIGGPLPQLASKIADGTRACDGTARVSSVPAGTGIRLRADIASGGDRGLLLDVTGHTVGLARPAPIADMPNPSPTEVARAVARAARTRRAPGGWIGFATLGAGGPFALLVLDRGGAPLCRVIAIGP
jgi:hypothetical protein